jgi:hypothetical protein
MLDRSRHSAALAVALCALGCGGGTGTGIGGAGPATGKLLLADRGEDIVVAIGADGASYYTGGMSEIARIDKTTGKRDVLAGWLYSAEDLTSPIEPPTEHAENLATDGAYLYYDAWGTGIYRLPLGVGYSSIQPAITSTEMGLVNSVDAFAQNGSQAFWATSDGTNEVVYARKLSGGSTDVVTTASAGVVVAANDAALYVCPPGGAISRYDLASGQVLTIPTGGPSFGSALATALSPSAFFWADSGGIHRIAHDGTTAELVVPGLTGISHLAVDDTTLYALDSSQDLVIGPPPVDTVHAIDVATLATTTLFSAEVIKGILARNGTLYWTSGYDLNARAPDGTTTVLVTDPTKTKPMSGALYEVAGKIVVVSEGLLSSNGVLRTYDLGTGFTQALSLTVPVEGASVAGNSLYVVGLNAGILQVPFDVPIRLPETLRYGVPGAHGFSLRDGWLYWSEYDSNNLGDSRIVRMKTDGTSFEVLFDRTHRGMLIDGELIYFACQSDCAYVDWTLVSMPIDGGALTPVAPLQMWPNDFAVGEGHVLVTDTADSGATFTIYAIDLGSGRTIELVKGLPFVGLTLQVKDGWLYTLDYYGAATRYQILNWTSTGPAIPIDATVPSGEPWSVVTALYADSGEFLTWRTGVGLTIWAR